MRLGKDVKKFQFVMTNEHINRVDNWRYANHIPSRNEALRKLIDLGLEKSAEMQAADPSLRPITVPPANPTLHEKSKPLT
ncbi:MAG: hypothetical protein AAFY76_25295 [Cyanobacteria bacterium J06649_11]